MAGANKIIVFLPYYYIKTIYDINPNMQIILSTHAPSMVEGWFDHVKEMEQITKG